MGFLSLVGRQDTFFEHNFWNISVLWFCLDQNSQSFPCGPWWFGGSGITGDDGISLRNVCYEAWQSHFLFLPANSKTCLRSCDIVIFGTDPFRRIFQLALQPYSFSVLSLTKTWIPFALRSLVAPLHQNLTFSGVFWIHPEYLEPAWLFLRCSSVSSTLIFIELALQSSQETLAGTMVPWKEH